MSQPMKNTIEKRIDKLKEARANNMLEGLHINADEFDKLLERAREPISDNEFVEKEVAAILAPYKSNGPIQRSN